MILFFDIDSTLVENHFSRRVISDVLAPLAAASGKSVPELAREMGQENERRQTTDPDHPLTMDWHDIIAQMAARCGVSLSHNTDALWNEYASAAEVEIVDDAPRVLQMLKDDGHTLVIATKGLWKYQEPVLRVTGLLPFFDDVLTPDRTGYLKTSPGYFNRYTSDTSLPRPFIQVGDHYYDDVICARRNGFVSIMRAVTPALQAALRPVSPRERPALLAEYAPAIPTYRVLDEPVLPDAVVVSLEELPALIGDLLRS